VSEGFYVAFFRFFQSWKVYEGRTGERMKIRFCVFLIWVLLIWFGLPAIGLAGGTEHAGEGTRGLGRGGANMTRPDDPYVMARNPAVLADMWGSMLYINTTIAVPDQCTQLSGFWGFGIESRKDSVISMGDGTAPLYAGAEEGMVGGPSQGEQFNLSPSATPYYGEPYPEICYSGGALLTPAVALSTRLSDRLGVGLGFLPPERAQGVSRGNSDGTLDTPYGRRPNPLRYPNSYQNVTYFSLLGAIGYKVLPWLRLGGGFRWTMINADSRAWSNGGSAADPELTVSADFYGQDLFIPGFTASVHVVPIDSLDIAVGYRWDDRVRIENAKVDINSSPFSFVTNEGDVFRYQTADGEIGYIGGPNSFTAYNEAVSLEGIPPAVPQLSFGIRYADRIRPRPEEYSGLLFAKDPVRDPMADEYWDIEFNMIYYFTSEYDHQAVRTDKQLEYKTRSTEVIPRPDGSIESAEFPANFLTGTCLEEDDQGECITYELNPFDFGGKDQFSLRLGGDVNVIPDKLAFRLGVSYETRGQNPDYLRASWTLPFERLGLHTGVTWRIDGRTDFSIGYAHFFQETIELAMNLENGGDIPDTFKYLYDENGNIVRELTEEELRNKYNIIPESEADGVTRSYIYSGVLRSTTGQEWKYAAGAGAYKFNLDVVSISLMRHF